MKHAKFSALAVACILLMTSVACLNGSISSNPASSSPVLNSPVQGDVTASSSPSSGLIYLYGEQHGVEKILEKEFELWSEYYRNENMRHLFVELPYYTAEFLNIWMQSDSDDIFDALYSDWAGTAGQNIYSKAFYQKIKSECPETIFHGTDVGHQYNTTGERFLRYLEDNHLKDSQQYLLVEEAIEQGKYFYEHDDNVYRENKMAENFIREFDGLGGENVMGIYGGAHTGLDAMDYYTDSVPCMGNRLKQRYGDAVVSGDLALLTKATEPLRVDMITVGGKKYEASYFGEQDLTGFRDFARREFWRLEDAYGDFKDRPKTGDVLPYDNYPMVMELEQVFVIDYTMTDGTVKRMYYRSDGLVWQGMPSTEEFKAE